MSSGAILFLGLFLDALLGEPKWLWLRVPHPIVLVGRIINALDKKFNKDEYFSPNMRKINGAIVLLTLIIFGGILGFFAAHLPDFLHSIIVAILIAHHSLCTHVRAVGKALAHDDVALARKNSSAIVGRDMQHAAPPEISRAAIESAAENLSDGVIAPIFWFLIAGLPGLFVYKIVNTADSMIGYKNARYAHFGWATARFDDVLNWVPARLSAALLAIAFFARVPFLTICSEARKHRSPNAGWPEAVMAFGLGIALSGPRRYDGHLSNDPFVNPAGKSANHHDISRSVYALWRVWGIVMAMIILYEFWLWIL